MKHLLRCTVAAFVALAPAAAVATDRPWQSLQMPTAAQVLSGWRDPPAAYGPEPYYGMGGPFTIESVRGDLDRMKALGFRAVTVQWARDAPFAYLSTEHLAFFKRFVAEAKARDMRVWIVDDAGYPSGFAGGKFSAKAPALRMKVLLPVASWTVAGGAMLNEAAPADLVAVSAIDAAGRTRDLPVSNGRIRWQAPPGQWTVTAVAHLFRTSPTRSDTNPARVKDESQSLQDYLDPAATAQYLAFTHEAYKAAVGDEFGKTILGFRGDEPDYSTPGLPWTAALFDRFRAEKGYDVRPQLAAILSAKAPLAGAAAQARSDYYDIYSRMFAENFFKPLAEWCAANGLEYSGHLNHEERQVELSRSEGDFFRAYAPVQVPGVDAIWHQIWPDVVADFPRFGSSAAHVYGHTRTLTESFAAYRPQPDLATARYIIDEQFVRGINLVEMMYLPSSALSSRPLAPFMADPAFPAWARYVSRMSYALSQGRPDASVALLQPRLPLWQGDDHADAMFVATERLLSERQIDFDIFDEDAAGGLLALENGAFVGRSGNRYRTVIVPWADSLPRAVVDRLKAFATGGGKVLFLGHAPSRLTGASYRDVRFAGPRAFAWAAVQRSTLQPVPTPPAQPPGEPVRPQIVAPPMLEAVDRAVGAQNLRLVRPDTALRVTQRKITDASLFLLFNESALPLSNEIVLSGPARSVEAWDAATGDTAPVPGAVRKGDKWYVPIVLAPHATALLAVR